MSGPGTRAGRDGPAPAGPAVTHDLIVIGSGPAGSAAAVTARRGGLTVALLDKVAFPRDKLCGGGVSGRARRYLAEAFGEDLPDDLFLACARVRLLLDGQVLGEQCDAPPLHLTMRHAFDAVLHDRARAAGCDILAPVRVVALEPDAGRVELADGRVLVARAVIGADGVNSAVARTLFGRAFDPDQIGFALEVEAPRAAPGVADAVEIDLGAAQWGYGWSFPKRRSVTLGVGGVARRNPDMKAHLATYLHRHGLAVSGLRVRGHFLPFGDFRKQPGHGRVLLAGDAAGLVDPITGEGIAWAIRSGSLAAAAVVQAVAAGRPDRAMAIYARALAPVHVELTRARALRRLVYSTALRGRFARALMRNARVQRRFLALLAGETDYADIGWSSLPRLLRDMVWRRGAEHDATPPRPSAVADDGEGPVPLDAPRGGA